MSWPCKKCCERQCPLCTFGQPRPAEWEVDLAEGGLVDDRCDYCDQIAGQYNLSHASGCEWDFFVGEVCIAPFTGTEDFRVEFQHFLVSANTWQWRVDVTLRDIVSQGGAVNMRIIYATTATTNNDCFHFGGQGTTDRIILTKSTDSFIQSLVCTGDLPNMIEAWSTT